MLTNIELTNIEFKILHTILKEKKGCRPSEIKELCKLTDPTLHKYLKKLVVQKYLIKKRGKQKRVYPQPVYYQLNSKNELLQNLLISAEALDADTTLSGLLVKAYCKISIAKEILKEHGIDAIEIDKRYHEIYGVKVSDSTEKDEIEDRKWEEQAKKANKKKGDIFTYKGTTGIYQGED